jgi:D-inositol-3-phosphate glycosyltransferase
VPSYSESFGLVAIESQACGTPVVAASVGGLRTAVADGRSGLLVPSHDPDEWARVLHRMTTGERDHLAAGARAHAEGFSWDATAQGLIDSYAHAIGTHAALPSAVGTP